jgi:hypothetical protein
VLARKLVPGKLEACRRIEVGGSATCCAIHSLRERTRR